MYRIVIVVAVAILLPPRLGLAWPSEVETATFTSPADGSPQKTLLYVPPGEEPVPLLVAFHTWSGDFRQDESPYAAWCISRGWAFLHPDLRGPANRPEAAGSDAAIADLGEAIAVLRRRRAIDGDRIYAVGVSGGGMMALMAAVRLPTTWAAASAWVPVTDLARWHADSKARKNKYAGEIEKVCGGPPGHSAEVDAAYAARSVERLLAAGPLSCPLDINTGIRDGHTGSVPVGHAVRAFNAVAAPAERVPDAVIDVMEKTRTVPEARRFAATDPLYASRPVLLRTKSGPARLTIFDGGHDIVHEAALTWLEAQARGRPPVWDVTPHDPPVTPRGAAAAGK